MEECYGSKECNNKVAERGLVMGKVLECGKFHDCLA